MNDFSKNYRFGTLCLQNISINQSIKINGAKSRITNNSLYFDCNSAISYLKIIRNTNTKKKMHLSLTA